MQPSWPEHGRLYEYEPAMPSAPGYARQMLGHIAEESARGDISLPAEVDDSSALINGHSMPAMQAPSASGAQQFESLPEVQVRLVCSSLFVDFETVCSS